MSAICAGNRSRNSPEIRQVTLTRGRPIEALGSTSTPVMRPSACSQTGRQPRSAKPCVAPPPVRKVALPHRSMTAARKGSPCICRCARTTSSAASRPKSIAVGVGRVRGSAVNRLRPVGSTSRRPCGRRAGRTGLNAPSVQRRQQSRAFGFSARLPCRVIAARSGAAVNVQLSLMASR